MSDWFCLGDVRNWLGATKFEGGCTHHHDGTRRRAACHDRLASRHSRRGMNGAAGSWEVGADIARLIAWEVVLKEVFGLSCLCFFKLMFKQGYTAGFVVHVAKGRLRMQSIQGKVRQGKCIARTD